MISPFVLERPAAWRAIGGIAVLLLAVAPAGPLLWGALESLLPGGAEPTLGGGFAGALLRSSLVGALAAGVAMAIGFPAGVLTALYEFRGRALFLGLLALPLLVPSFLWAIGWSALAARLGPGPARALSGIPGCVAAFSAPSVALTFFASYVAARGISASQVDSARIAGGERTVLRYACRHAAAPALLASALAGVLTLSDPGPGQILGLRTVAAEILVSFSALYDFELAGRQCAALSGIVLAAVVPLILLALPAFAGAVLPRQVRPPERRGHRGLAIIGAASLAALVASAMAPPVLGLVLPLARHAEFARAWRTLVRTGGNTVLYGLGGGTLAVSLGLALALSVGRERGLRRIALAGVFVLFSLPPALGTLGLCRMAAAAPPWADAVLRSRLTVCLAYGLRFFPVAGLLCLRAWGSLAPSWALAAALHGLPALRFLRKVALPILLPSLGLAVLLVGLLATADVGTVLLLHPPGESTLPLTIFTVMANAPESLVASLCLVYLLAALAILAAIWKIAPSLRARGSGRDRGAGGWGPA